MGSTPLKMRRIKDYKVETCVGMRKRSKICHRVRADRKNPIITKHMLFSANVAAQYTGVVLIKIEHTAAAAGIKDLGQ